MMIVSCCCSGFDPVHTARCLASYRQETSPPVWSRLTFQLTAVHNLRSLQPRESSVAGTGDHGHDEREDGIDFISDVLTRFKFAILSEQLPREPVFGP